MEPADWREMVDRVRELELALGREVKRVEANEAETVFIQRRCCRAARDLKPGQVLRREDIDVLRPVKAGAFLPPQLGSLVGKKIRLAATKGEALTPDLFLRTP
jgi:N-acetylneuraminate synthase